MQSILIATLAIVGCLLGVLMTALRLPGTWMIVLVGLGLGWWSEWKTVSANSVWLLVSLAAIGEAAEFGVSILTARRAGGSRRAALFGMIGGLIGMIATVSLPPPLLAPIGGAVLGCFVGATIGELWKRDRFDQSMKVGFVAAVGFALGMAVKVALALGMSLIVAWKVFRPE